MVRLYTCQACLNGNHEECAKSDTKKGCYGGSSCRCGCRGRSEKQWKKEENSRWESYKKLVFNDNKQNKGKNIQLD